MRERPLLQTVKSLSSVLSIRIFSTDIRVPQEVLPSNIDKYSCNFEVRNCRISASSSSVDSSLCDTNNCVSFISSSTAPAYWVEYGAMFLNAHWMF